MTNLPEDFCRNIFCEYEFYMDKVVYRTEATTERNRDPVIDYCHHHTVEIVTKFLLDYLNEGKLTIKIYGQQDVKGKSNASSLNTSNLNSSKSTVDNSGFGP